MLRAMILVCVVAACGESPRTDRPVQVGGDRPTEVGVPADFDDSRTYPLILVLHGYGVNGFVQRAYFGAGKIEDRGDAFVLAPDGLVDSAGRQFWNADDFCCDFDGRNPDDVGYLGGIVEEVMASYPIDANRVYAIGHSNGGFMAYRLACERADLFSAILSLAGNAVNVPCAPAQPVSVLHVHGDADATVPYSGAQPSVETWAAHNGCTGGLEPGAELDLDDAVPGSETQTSATAGCPDLGAVDLWRIEGGAHIPALGAGWEPAMWQWLVEHAR